MGGGNNPIPHTSINTRTNFTGPCIIFPCLLQISCVHAERSVTRNIAIATLSLLLPYQPLLALCDHAAEEENHQSRESRPGHNCKHNSLVDQSISILTPLKSTIQSSSGLPIVEEADTETSKKGIKLKSKEAPLPRASRVDDVRRSRQLNQNITTSNIP